MIHRQTTANVLRNLRIEGTIRLHKNVLSHRKNIREMFHSSTAGQYSEFNNGRHMSATDPVEWAGQCWRVPERRRLVRSALIWTCRVPSNAPAATYRTCFRCPQLGPSSDAQLVLPSRMSFSGIGWPAADWIGYLTWQLCLPVEVNRARIRPYIHTRADQENGRARKQPVASATAWRDSQKTFFAGTIRANARALLSGT